MNLHNEIVFLIKIICIQLGFIKLWIHISLLMHFMFLFNSTIHSSNKKPRINHFYEYSSDFAFISKIIMIMKIFNECLIFWKYSIFTRRNEYNRDFFSSSSFFFSSIQNQFKHIEYNVLELLELRNSVLGESRFVQNKKWKSWT